MADYEDMSYAELQAACKKRGLPARGKKVDMIAALEDADGAAKSSKKGRKAAAAPAATERTLLHSASRVPLPREAAATTMARSRRSAAAAPTTPAARTMARAGSRGGGSGRRGGGGRAGASRTAAAAGLVPVAAALLLAAAALGGAAKYTEAGGRVYDAAANAAAPAIAVVSDAAAAAGRVTYPVVARLEPAVSALSSAAAPVVAPLSTAAGAVKSAGFTASKTLKRQASVAWETAAAAGASAWDSAGSAGGSVKGGVSATLSSLADALPSVVSPLALLGRVKDALAAGLASSLSPSSPVPPGPACGPSLSTDLVPMIAAEGGAWAGARAALADAIATHGAAGGAPAPGDQPKATAVLLAGWDPVALGAAALAVAEAAPAAGECAGCVLVVQPEDVASSADLQAAVAPFLARCPGGVVALPRAHELPPAAAPALLALLGERGAFEVDGAPVPTSGSLVVLSAAAPAHLRGKTDEAALSAGAKAALGSALAGDGPGADGLAAALRRRIDVVVPLRE